MIFVCVCIVNNLNSENVLARRHYNCIQDFTMVGQLVGIREPPFFYV